MRHWVVEAYSDFEPEFAISALELYHAMRDRTLFFELLCSDSMDDNAKLVVVDAGEDCAREAVAWFSEDMRLLESVLHEPVEVIEQLLAKAHIPTYRVKGRPNDFLKRGVWMTEGHAWAVVGLTDYKFKVDSTSVNR